MKRPLVTVLLLTACSAPVEDERFVAAFRCESDVVFDAWRGGDTLRIDFMNNEHILRAVAADGVEHYRGEGMEAWLDDGTALLLVGARRYECHLDESVMQAIERGVDYRAIGQEPGWLLEVFADQSFELHYDYGAEVAKFPWVAPRTLDGARKYAVESAGAQLEIDIAVAPCIDVMSGQPYPDTVTVRYRDASLERELSGCGRPLPALDGSNTPFL